MKIYVASEDPESYWLTDNKWFSYEIEVTEKELMFIKKAFSMFDEAQELIRNKPSTRIVPPTTSTTLLEGEE